MRTRLALGLWLGAAGVGFAQAPEVSLVPVMRDAPPAAAADAPVLPASDAGPDDGDPRPEWRPSPDEPGLSVSMRPDPRPVVAVPAPPPEPEGPVGSHQLTVRSGLFGSNTRVILVPAFADDTANSVLISPRPELRPEGLEARVREIATRTTPARVTQPGSRGQLCGRDGIFGDRLEPITGRISGCGIIEPVRVREVDGITLSTPATINCNAATALQDWLDEARDIVGRTGGGIESLRVVASYSCRTRNNQPGARLSEHATGNGIDIAGIGLANGQELTVLGGWREETQGPILRRLHAAACGPFGTVLGPDGDRFHQDHFHFDVAGYRSGPFCR